MHLLNKVVLVPLLKKGETKAGRDRFTDAREDKQKRIPLVPLINKGETKAGRDRFVSSFLAMTRGTVRRVVAVKCGFVETKAGSTCLHNKQGAVVRPVYTLI